MRLLVCGDREWLDGELIERYLRWLKPTLVIHGAARGADSLADAAARALKIKRELYPYLGALGKAGGPARNQQMLREGRPDLVLAFHARIKQSRGTRSMIELANRAGVPVLLVPEFANGGDRLWQSLMLPRERSRGR